MNEDETTPEPELVDVVYEYTPDDIKTMSAGLLFARAARWEQEAFDENLKGAANQTLILANRWGASQLRDMAEMIASIPSYEIRQEEVEPEPEAPLEGTLAPIEREPEPNRRLEADMVSGTLTRLENPNVPSGLVTAEDILALEGIDATDNGEEVSA